MECVVILLRTLLIGAVISGLNGAITEWTEPPISTKNGNGTASTAVKEDLTIETTTGIKLAVDGGTGTVTFTIIHQPVTGQFAIGGTDSDEIFLKKPLDYEAKAKYILNITATESGPPQDTAIAIVTINIADVNDNDPVFQKSTYQITVVDNTPIGETVCTLTATDGDGTSPNKDIGSYAITDGDTDSDFAVSATGVITTAKALDHSRTPKYVLTLKATDGGSSARTGTATVSVTFGDTAACTGTVNTGGSNGDGDGNGGVGSSVVNILCLLLHLAAALPFNM